MWKQCRRTSLRLTGYDYSRQGFYFVTICTIGRLCYLGEIKEGTIELNDYGKIVENYWLQIPNHYKGVHLDEFVIMPNHIHGIILIVKENKGVVESVGVEQCSTPTDSDFATLESSATSNGHSYGLLSKIIKPFKDVTVKHIHRLGDYDFSWQRSFHDHIVRSEFALQRIRQYILDNPLKWNEGENNPKNFIMKHK